MRLEHAVSVWNLVFAVFKQTLIGDDEWVNLMDGMVTRALEKGEIFWQREMPFVTKSHTGSYITTSNCTKGKKVSTVCPRIKEYVFAFHTENTKVSWNINSLHSINYSSMKLIHAHMHRHLTFENSDHVAWTGTDMYTMALQWGEYLPLFPLV